MRTGVVLLLLLMMLSGCAVQEGVARKDPSAAIQPAIEPVAESSLGSTALTPEEEALLEDDGADDENDLYTVADPLEGFNRAMFLVNDRLYFWMLKPVTRGYRAVIPLEIRTGVSNFFSNLAAPIRVVNSLLQGKPRIAGAEVTRFMFNTTVGVLGFGDPAMQFPSLNPDPEDLGQTLGHYGIGDGFYIVWPLLGPSTLRDSVGDIGDRFLSPISYVDPQEASFALSGYKMVNTLSFRIGDYEALKQAALDPYQAMRNGYIQLRQARLKK
jgi:phospholipid-binding lipoprotein MlaA